MTIFLQVFAFIITNRAQMIEIIKGIEELIPDAPGNEKAAAVKNVIATSLAVGDEIDTAWTMVSPIFNRLVASVKAAN
jgi:hypothetical protein